jgi:hypothetical protein
VPLIIWGAHQGVEQVGMFSHEHEVEMTRRYRKDHDLMGFEADDLISIFDTLGEDDVFQYRYPDDHSLNSIGVRGIYLSNFVRWDPKAQHEKMVEEYGYKGASFSRTFDTYDYVDCFNYMGLHDLLKMIKHGFSKVTDHACREIRHGRLSRSEALLLVRHYEQRDVLHIEQFCTWLNINPRSLPFMLDQHRNKAIWIQKDVNNWVRHIQEIENIDLKNDSLAILEKIGFKATRTLCLDQEDKYITIGKGWPS